MKNDVEKSSDRYCSPADWNTSLKLSKYKNLEIEISWIWHLKPTTLPVIRVLWIILKGSNEYSNSWIPSEIVKCINTAAIYYISLMCYSATRPIMDTYILCRFLFIKWPQLDIFIPEYMTPICLLVISWSDSIVEIWG